jgi:hypothetical protein
MSRSIASNTWVAVPLAVLFALAVPTLTYMLPACESLLGENYQPLRALKFYASLGGEFHKYGTMPNFLLLPVYAPSFAWWWATGSFSGPSADFPYGLTDPVSQLSWLIFCGRLFFVGFGLAMYACLLRSLEAVTPYRSVIVVGFLVCIGTNWAPAHFLANTRPDGPTYAFVAASLAVYLRILYAGATVRRGVWLSLLAVAAISSKEIAGPVYVLPYLGLALMLYRESASDPSKRRNCVRVALASVGAGVTSYLVLNVVYAPLVWWARTLHWLGGQGTSRDVWYVGGSSAFTALDRVYVLFEGFFSTLGPGGFWVVLVGLASLVCLRPHLWGMLALPFVSAVALGLGPLGFSGDRFYSVGTVCLVPPVVAGLSELWLRVRETHRGRALAVAAITAVCVNAWYGTWAWHRLDMGAVRVIEDSLAREGGFEGTINVLGISPAVPNKSRLEWLGYTLDHRAIQELVESDPSERPDRIYVHAGTLAFIEDGRALPGRVELLRDQGLDLERFHGVESLGYRLRETVVTELPGWYPFGFMPSVQWYAQRSPILIYERLETLASS